MRRKTLFVALVGIALLLVGCGSPASPSEAAVAEPQPESVIAEGRLLPQRSMDQSFSIPGQVAEVLVGDGEVVAVGQVIARLSESPELQLALARAQQEQVAAQQALDDLDAAADLNLAQARQAVVVARAQIDSAREALTDAEEALSSDDEALDETDVEMKRADVDVAVASLAHAEAVLEQLEAGDGMDPDLRALAQARVASAEAAVVSAQAAIAARELRATIDGSVVDLDLQVGQRLLAGSPVMVLADLSGWIVETYNLSEADVTGVEVGQEVTVTLDALPDLTLEGEVTHVDVRSGERQGDVTYAVTVAIRQGVPQMRWGMTAVVRFPLGAGQE